MFSLILIYLQFFIKISYKLHTIFNISPDFKYLISYASSYMLINKRCEFIFRNAIYKQERLFTCLTNCYRMYANIYRF